MNITTNPALVTSTGTADTELVFTGGVKWAPDSNGAMVAFVEVVNGTFTFNIGADSTSGASYTTGDKFIVSIFPSQRNLHFKAGSASQTFRISV